MCANAERDVPEMERKSPRPKLTGRKFYESIGSPKMILAPMVDRSEFAWRALTRSFSGSDSPTSLLTYSPMLHARLFAERAKNRDQYFQPTRVSYREASGLPEGEPFLDGNPKLDRPLFVQFCANDPDVLLAAARYVEPFCDAVDLNLGCPQGIAKKGNYGAFLQENKELVYKLINKLHNELSIPVTAKLRILDTKESTLEYARTIVDAGASIITVHGRRREQKGHNTGLANWSYIKYLRDNLPPDTVIFANGNILNHDDLNVCLEATGADGIMSAEGNLSDPTIFANLPAIDENETAYWRGRNGETGFRVDAVFRRYLDIIYRHVLEKEPPMRQPLFMPSACNDSTTLFTTDNDDGAKEPPRKKQKRAGESRPSSPSLKAMQGHLFHMLRQIVTRHTDVRDALAKCYLGDIDAFERVLEMVERKVAQGLRDYENFPDGPTHESVETADQKTRQQFRSLSKDTVEKYKRPWWICQPYIRPLPEEAYETGALKVRKRELAEKERQEQSSDNPVSLQATVESEAERTSEVTSELPAEAVVCG